MIRLALRVRRQDAELALAELLELCPGGVEERDAGDVVEYAIYGAPGELPELPALRAAAGSALVDVSTSEVGDDWARRWRRFHRGVLVGERVHVRPPWESPLGRRGVEEVVIDPGQAFGTGAHATTRLCLELMLSELEPGGPFADLGCGSGVLAIVAAKLGFAPVLAVDHDPAALVATAANAAANGVQLELRRLDLRRQAPPAAPVAVANLLRALLLGLARRIDELPDALIVGGLLVAEVDELARAFAAAGLERRARRTEGDWAALALSSSR